MEKLKDIIKQHSQWQPIEEYIRRIETFLDTDFSQSLENAKALLESISKEICKQNNLPLGKAPKMNALIKAAFFSMGENKSAASPQISSALSTIGQHIGEVRNQMGTASHGKTLEELKVRNDSIDEITKEFLIGTTELVACFLIRNFETDTPSKPVKEEETLSYLDCEDFNEFWDEQFQEHNMGDYTYLASEILYNVDEQAYSTEYQAYNAAP